MTHRQTNGHGDSMTDPAQRAESVKKIILINPSIKTLSVGEADYTGSATLLMIFKYIYFQFHMIPASVLMTEIHPLGLVPKK